MHRPLGRAALVVYAPFSLTVVRLHCIARWAARCAAMQWIRLFVFAAFWVGAKCGKHFSVLNLAKIL